MISNGVVGHSNSLWTPVAPTIYYYSNNNLGWIRGKINNHEIRIVFIRIPEADEDEEVKDNDTIEILRIVDCNLAKSIYNSDVYEGDALL